jgi:hypothetical protein
MQQMKRKTARIPCGTGGRGELEGRYPGHRRA